MNTEAQVARNAASDDVRSDGADWRPDGPGSEAVEPDQRQRAAAGPERVSAGQRLAALAMLHSAAVLAVDRAGHIVCWNRRFTKLWGLSDEPPGRNGKTGLVERLEARLKKPGCLLGRLDAGSDGDHGHSSETLELEDGRVFERTIHPQREGQTFLGWLVTFRDLAEPPNGEGELQERVRLAALLAEVNRAMTQRGLLPEVLQRCVALLVERLPVSAAGIYTLTLDEQALLLRASAGQASDRQRLPKLLALGHDTNNATGRQPTAPPVTQASPTGQPADLQPVQPDELTGFVRRPLVAEGRLVGLLALDARQPLGAPVVEMLAAIADALAVGILQKQVVRARQVAEQRFQSVWENSADGMRLVDGTGTILAVNPAYCALVGMSADELVGRPFTVVYSQVEDRAAWLAEFRDRFASHALQRCTTRKVTLQSGQVVDLELTSSYLQLGEQTVVLNVFRDITARVRMETELARERDLLNALLDNLPDHIYFKDLESRFVRVSASKVKATLANAREMYRAAHPEVGTTQWPAHLGSPEAFGRWLIGKTDADTYPEAHARAARADEEEIIRSGRPMEAKEEKATLPDGSVIWWLTAKMPWRDPHGNIIGTFGISRDITAQKEAQLKLEQVHQQLVVASRQAGMAEVATSVLHNVGNALNSVNTSAGLLANQLRASKIAGVAKVAELLQTHRADLAGFLNQEGRVDQLIGYLNKLSEHLASEQRSLLAELQSLASCLDHIKDIVAMQQSYARLVGVCERVAPEELVEDALRLNANTLARHDITVVRQFEPNLPEITVEKHKVIQVLVNLIRNAKYACDDSGRTDKQLTLRLKRTADRLQIMVSDNGVGIPAENLSKLFQYGFTTRKQGHGFGLYSGLLVARELGGDLRAESDGPGRGATFILELPFAPPTPTS